MVYSIDLLSTNTDLEAQQIVGGNRECSIIPKSPYVLNKSPMVSVVYNDQRIEDITGPTPFVDFSTTLERSENNVPNVRNNKIVLTGKIVRGGTGPKADLGSGIKPVMFGINDLKKLFDCNECGVLTIECAQGNGGGYSPLFTATGVRVTDLSFSKSDDNWIFTSDYSVTLEYLEPSFPDRYIRSYTDSWNIEQLEDEYYTYNLYNNVTQKVEWDNPNALGTTTQAQTQSQTGANSIGKSTLTNFNVPKYKVSRTISAVGIASGSDYCKPNPNDMYSGLDYASYNTMELNAFNNAKAWVQDRAQSIITPYSLRNTSNPSMLWSPLVSGYLYNHVRAVKFDISAASYEITDTYLAMPTGIAYTESYTIEISTDNKYIHTVSVQGEIAGLSIPSIATIADSGLVQFNGNRDTTKNNEELILGLDLKKQSVGIPIPAPRPADFMTADSKSKTISDNRYDNALNGWIYDIKPYLYRRACAAMNSVDRTKGYINPTQWAQKKPPNNPIYSQHGVLNIIPISTTEGHDTRKGKITYNHQFNNKFTIISGALYESVNITTNGPADVISEAFVLGRQLGPILQDLGAKTSTKKNITIEVGVVPPSTINGYFLNHPECPLWTGGTVYSTIDMLVTGLAPYGDRDVSLFGGVGVRRDVEGRVFVNQDDHTWNPSEGVYTRNIGWTYQPCTIKQSYLDN